MDNKKIIDGKEYYQIPVDKVYIDGIEFGNTFTTEELLAAKKDRKAHLRQMTAVPTGVAAKSVKKSEPSVSSLAEKKSKSSITLNKNLFIALIVCLVGVIVSLVILLL